MITNYLTRLYCGMVSRMYLGNGTETPTMEKMAGTEPEQEIQELLLDIRTRVSILKEEVEEGSRLINDDEV